MQKKSDGENFPRKTVDKLKSIFASASSCIRLSEFQKSNFPQFLAGVNFDGGILSDFPLLLLLLLLLQGSLALLKFMYMLNCSFPLQIHAHKWSSKQKLFREGPKKITGYFVDFFLNCGGWGSRVLNFIVKIQIRWLYGIFDHSKHIYLITFWKKQ